MKKVLKSIILPLVIALGVIYIVVNVIKSSPKKIPAKSPVLTESPARVYGIVEPEGGEVYVSPPLTRQVVKAYVKERASVEKGQRLCRLENSVEKAQYEASLARVELAFKALELSRDKFERNKSLLANKAISEYEYKQLRLNLELDSLNLVAARREADLAKARLEQLDLKSPIEGIVYKFEVKLGESFPAGDNSRIIIGKPGLWARLYVEAFWTDRVKIGDVYQIRNSETNQLIGKGKVISKAPYLGGKVFRTNDVYERFDVKYQEIICQVQAENKNIPIGLSVLAEIKNDN